MHCVKSYTFYIHSSALRHCLAEPENSYIVLCQIYSGKRFGRRHYRNKLVFKNTVLFMNTAHFQRVSKLITERVI